MRKRRKERKIFGFRGIIVAFIITTLFISVGYSLLAEQLSVSGITNLVVKDLEDEFRTANLSLKYKVKQWYSNGKYFYQYDFTLTNIGTANISSWNAVLDYPTGVSMVSGWSAGFSLTGNKLTISSLDYNGALTPGQVITFGVQLTMNTDSFDLSTGVLTAVIPGTEPINTSKLRINAVLTSSWGTAGNYFYQYEFTVTNKSKTNLTYWKFAFNVPTGTTIGNYWNCNYINANNVVTVSNAAYNGNLSPGASTSFGMIINTPQANFKPVVK